MKINKEELLELYMEWVNKVAEDFDWKTTFGPEEIVHSIANIIEKNPQLIQVSPYAERKALIESDDDFNNALSLLYNNGWKLTKEQEEYIINLSKRF